MHSSHTHKLHTPVHVCTYMHKDAHTKKTNVLLLWIFIFYYFIIFIIILKTDLCVIDSSTLETHYSLNTRSPLAVT